ncbi:MAG: ABC transporter ATP-binding protein [Candidatus Promineifilaceae bacterium]
MNTLPSENIIYTNGLSKHFDGVSAVENLTLEIPLGIIFGFIGPSGCGKTTSVRLLLGIYKPDNGDIEVLGHRPEKFSHRERAQIGYMPQQFILYPELDVWENMNFVASLYGYPLRRKERLEELLELVELTGQEHKKVRNLSGGMKNRLSLATSIIHKPRLLFLDEPTAGIDPMLRRKFWDYFQQLKKQDRTLFVTTQYVGEAAYCDYVGIMMNGRLVDVDTPEGLRRKSLGGEVIHLQCADYLSAEQLEKVMQQPFVEDGQARNLADRVLELIVDDAGKTLPALLEYCNRENITVVSAEEYAPPFDDIFVQLIEQQYQQQKESAVA